MELTLIQKIVLWALPVIFAITFHEVAHGYVASFFGDPTARFMGRLSLNPMRHIDWLGTVVVPLLMLAFTHFVFGWAKPVPVDPRNLRNPRRDMALVSLAGPMANLLMAFFWAGLLKVSLAMDNPETNRSVYLLAYMGQAGILINVVVGVLNLLPLPPLDGGKVLASLLPRRAAYYYYQLEPYGFFILLALLMTGSLNLMLTPLIEGALYLVNTVFSFG